MEWTKENTREYLRTRYREQRVEIFSILGGKCAKCGSAEGLEVDHIDPEIKSFSVGQLWGSKKKWVEVLEELKKCQALCSGCHKKKTLEYVALVNRARNVERNGPDGFRHGSMYGWMRKKCQCAVCIAEKWRWNDARNEKRRSGPGYKKARLAQSAEAADLNPAK